MKRILSFILCALILLSAFSANIYAIDILYDRTYVLGDADGNKSVNALDLIKIKQNIVLGEDYPLNKDAVDINADGEVTSSDVFSVKNAIVGNVNLAEIDKEEGTYKFTIAGNNEAPYTVSVPSGYGENTNVQFAAEQYRQFVNLATGRRPVITYGECDGPCVVFHAVDYYNTELGKKLGVEGYKYDVTDGRLNIYGTYRGNMYAVYEILEDYLGYRFFSDDYTFVWKHRVVDIPEGTSQFVYPEIYARHCSQSFRDEEWHVLPRRMNFATFGSSDFRHGLKTGSQFINAHSFGYYWAMGTGGEDLNEADFETRALYLEAKHNSGEQKDEYNWQPCANDEETYQIMITGMKETMEMIQTWGYGFSYIFDEEHLGLNIYSMSFSGCDNTKFCHCRICKNMAEGTPLKRASTGNIEFLNNTFSGRFTTETVGTATNVIFQKEGYSGVYINLANRAAKEIQKYYPGMRVHSILYDHTVPATVRPDSHLNVWYCGSGCNNHWLGSHECSEKGGQLNGSSNRIDEESLPGWGGLCEETGAQLWFWYYPVTYHYYLYGCPNIFNIYYDYKFLAEECGVKGIYYEGGGQSYNFETLKAYLASLMAWNPHMSYDDFIAKMKEYLYMYYGDGYEELYRYIVMQNEAGDLCGTCFINNYDRPGDMCSYEYIAEHYEEMRELLLTAERKANRRDYRDRIVRMRYCLDFLGLSTLYKSKYAEGSAEDKAWYEDRYETMMQYFWDTNIRIFSDESIYKLPRELDYTKSPMEQFYEDCSRRPANAWS